jgi:hypothetical protein
MDNTAYERDRAIGQLVTKKNRLKKIHLKAGQLLGEVYREVDTLIGEDFMNKNLELAKDNMVELIQLQREAKAISKSIDSIQARYNFDDLDLE